MKNWAGLFWSQLGFGIEVIDKKVVDAGAWVYTQTLKFLEFVRIQGSEASGDHPFMIRIYWHGRQGMKWFKMFHFQIKIDP